MNQTLPSKFIIDFEPVGKRVILSNDQTLMDAALLAGLDLITSCNGLGICASCKVTIVRGTASDLTAQEKTKISRAEIDAGIRLACQVKPCENLRVFIPPASLLQGQQLQIDGHQNQISFNPTISAFDLDLPAVEKDDTRSIWRRLQDTSRSAGVELQLISLDLLRKLPDLIKPDGVSIRIVHYADRLIQILPSGSSYYGLAFDIGSTKIAAYWVDLVSGATILQAGIMNPQISFGEDVVNRIAYANLSVHNLQQLQTVLIDSINQHIQETCTQLAIDSRQIVDLVAVGNSAIHHLLLAIPVRSLGEAPYTPAIHTALQLPAIDLGLQCATGALIYLPPLVAGYVGADHISALAATRFDQMQETSCLIDVGTNTEISLIYQGRMSSCSCASGPAFEGAHIHDGMRAAPGAIEKVKIKGNEILISTIADRNPVGICGSGILSAIAEMLNCEIIDARGVFQSQHPLTKQKDKQKFLILAERREGGLNHPIRISRHDVHEIQLAKGAIRTGIEVLCKHAGISARQIMQFFIAGAFGSHLDIGSAITIGMFPDVDQERYHQIGNAAGVGAKEMLVNKDQRFLCEALLPRINYIELTSQPGFQDLYVSALMLEKSDQLDSTF